MGFTTELTRRFGLRYPVRSAPMGAVAGGRLAAAVSRAGGLGPGYLGADWIETEFAAAAGERVGVGFITWDLQRTPAPRSGGSVEHSRPMPHEAGAWRVERPRH